MARRRLPPFKPPGPLRPSHSRLHAYRRIRTPKAGGQNVGRGPITVLPPLRPLPRISVELRNARSADELRRQLEELSNYIELDLINLVENVILMLEANIISHSPADTGAYIMSHGIVNGSNPETVGERVGLPEHDGGNAFENGLRAAQAAIEKASRWHWDGVSDIILYNNLPYAEIIEYGGYPINPVQGSYVKRDKTWVIKSRGGYSKQAPLGVYSVAEAEIIEYLQREIAKHELWESE